MQKWSYIHLNGNGMQSCAILAIEIVKATSLQYDQLKVVGCWCMINQLQTVQLTNTKLGIISMSLY